MTEEAPRRRSPDELRSHRWFGVNDMRSFTHRQRMQQMGLRRESFLGRPVVAIVNTWSGLNACHQHLRERAETVRLAVAAAGGLAVELPALSLAEPMLKPTAMLYRNLLALETEELLRSHPVDGAVLLGGCDKTTPALIMGALSAGLPAIVVPAGPQLNGHWRGQKVGTGTHMKRYWEELRAGTITQDQWVELEGSMTRSFGTCNTMGTASTMTAIAEAMGLTLPGASSIPASDSRHTAMAAAAGARIVDLIWQDMRPGRFVTAGSVRNAAVACMALGGSTNAAIHLIAMARRADVPLTLDDLDRIAREVPVLADLMPSGAHLMEDFFRAGGLPALLRRVADRLDLACPTVGGTTIGEAIAAAEVYDDTVIRPLDKPVTTGETLAVLRGNLAPDGAVIKASAASGALMRHTGRAVVFESMADLQARIDDEGLDVDETSVLVLRNAGPIGGPGMPEWGNLPIPKKLLRRGVRDMVRVSDARMSGTYAGTCVLHVAPEAQVGGPLALVRDGDPIRLDVAERRLELLVSDEELARRRTAWTPPPPPYARGYGALFARHVGQANEGCDFDFLADRTPTPEPVIF